MQILFWILLCLFGLFLSLCLLILVYPCHYFIEGRREGNFCGVLSVKVGLLKITLSGEIPGNHLLELYLWKWKLINTLRQDCRREKKNKYNMGRESKATDAKNNIYRFLNFKIFRVWVRDLNKEKLSIILELCRNLWRKMTPQKFEFRGKVGFANPYYTGLLAAFLSIVPSGIIDIRPDFSRPICEFSLQMKGQIFLGAVLYYILTAFMKRPLRLMICTKRKKIKEEKEYGLSSTPGNDV